MPEQGKTKFQEFVHNSAQHFLPPLSSLPHDAKTNAVYPPLGCWITVGTGLEGGMYTALGLPKKIILWCLLPMDFPTQIAYNFKFSELALFGANRQNLALNRWGGRPSSGLPCQCYNATFYFYEGNKGAFP